MQMSTKLTLSFLAMASAAALALPSMAMAVEEDVPLHVTPKPTQASSLAGGAMNITDINGRVVTCREVRGTATWETSTTGSLSLTFSNNCVAFGIFPCESIVASGLTFHLVTVPKEAAGILLTHSNPWATFICSGQHVEITGNGLVGTITAPACGFVGNTMTVKFEGTGGVQKHKRVEGTLTEYHLNMNGVEAAVNLAFTMTFPEGNKKLECT
jgi:hypothetical protein